MIRADYTKAIAVIRSCKTVTQMNSAMNYARLFALKYKNAGYEPFFNELCELWKVHFKIVSEVKWQKLK